MKRILRVTVLCFFALLAMASCNKSANTLTLVITPDPVMKRVGLSMAETEHMVAIDEAKDTLYFYLGEIHDFKYEKGFEYKIEVKKTIIDNPPADASNVSYSLVKVISKSKK